MISPLSILIRPLAIFIACLFACGIGMSAQPDKPRVVILTDISNEPDDQQSLVRFLTDEIALQDDGFAYIAHHFPDTKLISARLLWRGISRTTPRFNAWSESRGGNNDALAATPVHASIEPRVVPLDFAVGENGEDSVIAADLDGSGVMDFVVTAPGKIGAYRQDGERLWLLEADVRVSAGSSESRGLPGHHAPGVQVADIEGNGQPRLLYVGQADRLYVADVSGDWREDIIVINGRELRVYENPDPNPRPHQPRLWERQHYRRNKMTWNYYSP